MVSFQLFENFFSRRDDSSLSEIITIGKVKLVKESSIVLCSLKNEKMTISVSITDIETETEKLEGANVRVFLKKTPSNIHNFSVLSLKILENFDKEDYYQLLEFEKKIDTFLFNL